MPHTELYRGFRICVNDAGGSFLPRFWRESIYGTEKIGRREHSLEAALTQARGKIDRVYIESGQLDEAGKPK